MNPRQFKARKINETSEFNTTVDIIVPYYGQYDRVTALLESIFRLTRSNYYFVYVVDDCSPNALFGKAMAENAQRNAERHRQSNVVHCFRNEKQLGFAGSCRAGFERGKSPYACFIQSDCLIEDSGWLQNLGESLLALKEKGVRMVAPMTNNPTGGDPEQYGEKFARSEHDYILPENSHLSMYCFLCHRELFSHCGGFVKEYPYGYYEDEEFAARMKKYGFKQAVCKSSWVRHEGSATVRELMRTNEEVRRVMEQENRKRCVEDLKRLTEIVTS